MKIKRIDLLVIVLTFLLVHTSLIQRIMSATGYYYIRWLISIALIGFLVLNLKLYRNVKKDTNTVLGIIILCFCASSIYSSYINRAGTMFHVGIFNVIFVLVTFGILNYIKSIEKENICLDTLLNVLLFYCLVNDFLLLFIPSIFYGNGQFLLYSKFLISYLHMVLITLHRWRRNNIFTVILWIFSVIICSVIKCSTGIIGLVLLLFFNFIPKKVYDILRKPMVATLSMIGCSLFILVKDAILTIPAVEYIITSILNETTDLSSRVYIYDVLENILSVNPWWGFGAENNYAACQKYLVISAYESAPNAQNGLFDWMVSYGIVGTGILLILLFLVFKNSQHKKNNCFLALIYVFFVMGSVEIVFDIIFFFILAVYYLFGDAAENKDYEEMNI